MTRRFVRLPRSARWLLAFMLAASGVLRAGMPGAGGERIEICTALGTQLVDVGSGDSKPPDAAHCDGCSGSPPLALPAGANAADLALEAGHQRATGAARRPVRTVPFSPYLSRAPPAVDAT